MMPEISFLDPRVLASISNLELRAKTAVEGFVTGLHKSPYRGFSVEFTDYRHYHPGDDIRHVDWKVYARSGEYFIKQYQDETNLRCHILLDCSASMAYGSESISKLEYGRTLAAALSYFMVGQRDAVGLITFDDRLREYLPARYRRGHLMLILQALARVHPGEGTDLARPISELALGLNRRSMAIVISDLLDDEAAVVQGLQHLRSKGNDVIVFHIMDDAELNFPFERLSEFEDSESHKTVAVAPRSMRETYLAELEKFCGYYRQKCRAGGIDYCLLNTAEPLDIALASYLSKRAKQY
jgi:uncharacterized protein (DUF58 family)